MNLHDHARMLPLLLLLVVPLCFGDQPVVTWETNLTIYTKAYQPPLKSLRPLGAHEAHTWCLVDMPRCKGPLVIEFWEERESAGLAVPLLHGASLCPVLADKSYAHFNGYPPPTGEPLFDIPERDPSLGHHPNPDAGVGGGGGDGDGDGSHWGPGDTGHNYPTTSHHKRSHDEQGGGAAPSGSESGFGSGVQWDAGACGLQLPYHWVIKYWEQGDGFFETGWWVHVMNLRNTSVPEYQIRATCVMDEEEAPCPDPLLQQGRCSAHGACTHPLPAGVSAAEYGGNPGVCTCEPGWVGVGCQVPAQRLPLSVPQRVVASYNPDSKLVWNSTLNTPWSLMQIAALPSWEVVVVEMDVDWSAVGDADVSTLSQPRLCWEGELTDDVVLRHLHCQAPLAYPLTPRTGFTVAATDFVNGLLNVIVADVGPYPVTLLARPVAGRRQDSYCPFNCSGFSQACDSGTCTCSSSLPPAGTADRDGNICQYLSSELYPGETEQLQLTLGAGQATQWSLEWLPCWQGYTDGRGCCAPPRCRAPHTWTPPAPSPAPPGPAAARCCSSSTSPTPPPPPPPSAWRCSAWIPRDPPGDLTRASTRSRSS